LLLKCLPSLSSPDSFYFVNHFFFLVPTSFMTSPSLFPLFLVSPHHLLFRLFLFPACNAKLWSLRLQASNGILSPRSWHRKYMITLPTPPTQKTEFKKQIPSSHHRTKPLPTS
jgi:hypothetical protein